MKNFIMAIAVLLVYACNDHIVPSYTPYQNKEFTNNKGTTMLIGRNATCMMQQGSYKEWFEKNYNSYATDSATISQLSGLLKNKTIEVFLGSWCGDSKREVPRMIKVLEQAGFDTTELHLVFVDHAQAAYKQSPEHEEQKKNIHHVPTFIVYENKKEMGRIVESPNVSLEKDLLSICKNDNYTPKYKAILKWQKLRNRNKTISRESLEEIAAQLKNIAVSTGEFNAYGYMLYAAKQRKQAGNVFVLNTILFPDRPGTFDSLGEYYFLEGNKTEARKCYEKVLILKPDDANAKKMLEQL